MNYAEPHYLSTAFYAALLLAVFYLFALYRRRVSMERFAEKGLIEGIAPSSSVGRRILKAFILISAMSLGIFALARPQWGFEWEETKRARLDMLIAMDVSKSMLARDVKPNRLERSKFAVRDLVKRLNGDRIGLIAFAGTSFLQCPLTIDYNGFLLALDDMNTETIPRPGTSLSGAIRTAVDTFRGPEKKYKVLVIVTDGEELEGDAVKAAESARDLGIKIYCVGVGTREGEPIPTVGEAGERGYLADGGGKVVKTRLNEDLLRKIALATGGGYVRATQSDFGLTRLYDEGISKLEKRDIDARMTKRYEERFQIFLAIAVALLFMEPLISERRRVLP